MAAHMGGGLAAVVLDLAGASSAADLGWAGLAVLAFSATLARTDFPIPAHPALGMFEPTCRVPVGFRTTSFHIISTVWVYPTTVCAATVNLGSHVAVPATYVLENLVPGQSPSCLTTFRV